MSVSNVSANTQQTQCQGKKEKDSAAHAQKRQEYQDLVNQAQSLGITNIPAPGKGAIASLEALIAQKQSQQGNNNSSNNSLFSAKTVGLTDNFPEAPGRQLFIG